MGNIIKKDLVEALSLKTGLTYTQSKYIVNYFFDAIKDALKEGRPIEIRDFGRFKLKYKEPAVKRNPRTGEKIEVGKRVAPVFKASKSFIQYATSKIKGG